MGWLGIKERAERKRKERKEKRKDDQYAWGVTRIRESGKGGGRMDTCTHTKKGEEVKTLRKRRLKIEDKYI